MEPMTLVLFTVVSGMSGVISRNSVATTVSVNPRSSIPETTNQLN